MKIITTFASIAILLISFGKSLAQGEYLVDSTVPVTINGSLAKNPWVGGFNAPIFSEIDLNGDGIKDLFAFDKDGDRITTYINNGTPNTVDYISAPEYKKKFPQDLHDWVLLKDFNCDGKEDIFTYSNAGMAVYRNEYSVSTGLKFTLIHATVNSLYSGQSYNLYVARVNLPALVDVNYDGDLDVLTFPVTGSFVEYHENKAMEYFNRCDTLVYEINPDCFGNFGLSGLSNTGILNVNCRLMAPAPNTVDENSTTLHAGSCMIAFDVDGDFDRDILNGDILGNNLLLLTNTGDSTYANMTIQDTTYPSYNNPVNMVTFPSPYYLDVNNDGNRDLVVAPCISASAENFNNVLYYRNTTNNSTNVFDYQQSRFLSEEMIEVGSGSNVTFTDIDSDGLMDIIVGNNGYFSAVPPFESGLSYYRNTGTATTPAFTLQTIDFGNLFTALPTTGLDPAFGDIDSDGDSDLLLGNSDGTLIHYENIAGAGNIPVYFFASGAFEDNFGVAIDVGNNSSPQIIDVNKDGKLDLLIGAKSGKIYYYENTGTGSTPVFTLFTALFGGVNVTDYMSIYGHSNPCLYDSAGVYQLLVGSVSGYIYQFNNIDNNLNGTFNLVDSMFYNIREANRSTIDVADLNNDGKNELLVGNNAGGITLYKYQASSDVPEINPLSYDFTLYPNPSSGELFVKFSTAYPAERMIEIYDVVGRKITEKKTFENIALFNTAVLANGVYHCRVIEGSKVTTVKFMVAGPR